MIIIVRITKEVTKLIGNKNNYILQPNVKTGQHWYKQDCSLNFGVKQTI